MIEIKKVSEMDNGFAIFQNVLIEATRRMTRIGLPMWPESSLTEEKLSEQFSHDEMMIGFVDDIPAFTFVLLHKDDRYWGNGSENENAFYIHKVAVTDAFTGKGMPEILVAFAKNVAIHAGKSKLRLDTRASRPKLHELYERLGFVRHHEATILELGYDGIFYEMNI